MIIQYHHSILLELLISEEDLLSSLNSSSLSSLELVIDSEL